MAQPAEDFDPFGDGGNPFADPETTAAPEASPAEREANGRSDAVAPGCTILTRFAQPPLLQQSKARQMRLKKPINLPMKCYPPLLQAPCTVLMQVP